MRLSAVLCVLVCAAPAFAWDTYGCVYCDANGNGVIDSEDVPLQGVTVNVESTDGSFTGSAITDEEGCFIIPVLDEPASYVQTMDTSNLPVIATPIIPANGVLEFTLDYGNTWKNFNWLFECTDREDEGACWLTGGGVKFVREVGMKMGNCGPIHNFGGNIFPSCDPDPGDGGNWNHVDHAEDLHFKGTDIDTVVCGNVPGIEPGSESPVTPFNFIEAWGTGTLKGIAGNDADHGMVYFHIRCEDRNEPGNENSGQAGADIDRYFLHVYSDPNDPEGSTLLLVDDDGDASTVDPETITGGNLQIHISSCDDPPAFAQPKTTGNGKKK